MNDKIILESLTYFKFQKDLEVKDQLEKEKSEQKSPRQKEKNFIRTARRNSSFGSANSDMIQDRHGWALDGLIEKEANMNKEIINPSVEPEEVKIVVSQERPAITAEIFHKMEYTEQYDRNVWNMLINQLVDDTSHSNVIPTKEAIKEFDDNNKMMNERLAKEDKRLQHRKGQGRLK
ncbi:20348_t:CDS:2 [Rhizophagus irregularis]|nr:20348_t:CDS:2 [Rhizophagus irregularis]